MTAPDRDGEVVELIEQLRRVSDRGYTITGKPCAADLMAQAASVIEALSPPTPVADGLVEQARELLAAEAGMKRAPIIRSDLRLDSVTDVSVAQALRAIVAALSSRPSDGRDARIKALERLLHLYAYPGVFTGRPSDEALQAEARALISNAAPVEGGE